MALEAELSEPKKPRRCLLYGVPGIGKTTFGSQAPNPVFIQTEDGMGHLDNCARFPLSETLADVVKRIGQLYNEEHDHQTVVLDSADWLERRIWEEVAADQGVKSIDDISHYRGYLFAVPKWRNVLEGFDALRNDRNMHIIILAHSKVEKFDDPEGDAYERYSPRLNKHASAIVQDWCDEVLFAKYQATTIVQETFGNKKHKAIGDGSRVIRTQERPAHMAKNRLGMELELPFTEENSFAEYAKHF